MPLALAQGHLRASKKKQANDEDDRDYNNADTASHAETFHEVEHGCCPRGLLLQGFRLLDCFYSHKVFVDVPNIDTSFTVGVGGNLPFAVSLILGFPLPM